MAHLNDRIDVKSRDRKARVLEAAKIRFLHYGYKKTSIDEIASDAEISKASIYQIFENKKDILMHLIDIETTELLQLLSFEAEKVRDPVKKLEVLFLKALKDLDERPFLVRVLQKDPEIISPKWHKQISEIEKRLINLVEGYVREALQDRKGSVNASEIIAYLYFKMFEAFSYGSTWDGKEELNTEMVMKMATTTIAYMLDTKWDRLFQPSD